MADWGLTKSEKYIILFLVLAFVIGLGIRYYKLNFIEHPDPQQVDYSRIDSLRQEFIQQSQPVATTPAVVSKTGTFPARPLIVNINSASLQELMKLPRVGPVMAERILKYREEKGPFQTITELQKVKGIGAKTFNDLKVHITVK